MVSPATLAATASAVRRVLLARTRFSVSVLRFAFLRAEKRGRLRGGVLLVISELASFSDRDGVGPDREGRNQEV
jgi:hypothetical protein